MPVPNLKSHEAFEKAIKEIRTLSTSQKNENLIKHKEAIARPKDLEDIDKLEKIYRID